MLINVTSVILFLLDIRFVVVVVVAVVVVVVFMVVMVVVVLVVMEVDGCVLLVSVVVDGAAAGCSRRQTPSGRGPLLGTLSPARAASPERLGCRDSVSGRALPSLCCGDRPPTRLCGVCVRVRTRKGSHPARVSHGRLVDSLWVPHGFQWTRRDRTCPNVRIFLFFYIAKKHTQK